MEQGLWCAVMDERKQQMGLDSDAALARELGFTPQYISDVRRGKPASPRLKYELMERADARWTAERMLLLMDEQVAGLILARLQGKEPGSLSDEEVRGFLRQQALG